jgi:hypothetical protein
MGWAWALGATVTILAALAIFDRRARKRGHHLRGSTDKHGESVVPPGVISGVDSNSSSSGSGG